MDKAESKYLKEYFILTYLVFWLMIGVIGYLISIDIPVLAQDILKNICAWAPTFVIFAMFKKLYPGLSFKEYLKMHFTTKINLWDFLSSFLLQAAVVVAAVIAFFMT